MTRLRAVTAMASLLAAVAFGLMLYMPSFALAWWFLALAAIVFGLGYLAAAILNSRHGR